MIALPTDCGVERRFRADYGQTCSNPNVRLADQPGVIASRLNTDKSGQSYTMNAAVSLEGVTMGSLINALQQLRAERREAQLHVEKLDQAISVMESLNASGTSPKTRKSVRVISATSRRKMALAQKARWAKARKESQPAVGAMKPNRSGAVKRTMSVSARRKIAAAQRARWAKIRSGQKKTA
jgi:hypothetical protein